MTYPMYSYRDVKSNGFTPPMVCVNEAVAKRDFDYRLHNDASMGFAASDYEMYMVGSFDPETGKVEGCLPEFVIGGAELL